MRHRCGRCKEQVWDQEDHCSNCGADLKPGKASIARARVEYVKPKYKKDPVYKNDNKRVSSLLKRV
jgi:methionyl-tRNA synthetase